MTTRLTAAEARELTRKSQREHAAAAGLDPDDKAVQLFWAFKNIFGQDFERTISVFDALRQREKVAAADRERHYEELLQAFVNGERSLNTDELASAVELSACGFTYDDVWVWNRGRWVPDRIGPAVRQLTLFQRGQPQRRTWQCVCCGRKTDRGFYCSRRCREQATQK